METAAHPLAESSAPPIVGTAWDALLRGQSRFVEIVRSDATCRVVLCDEDVPERARLGSRERAVVRRFAEGHEQKVIAYELGVGPCTVCGHLRAGLEKLGIPTWQQGVLVATLLTRSDVTTHAVEEEDHRVGGHGCGPHRMIRAELCRSALGSLTPTEKEIALRVADGRSTLDIAEERSASPRTVANQLASISEKLGTRGRQALIRRLARPS